MIIEGMAVLKIVGPLVVAGAAAYGGTKQALNGTRERVKTLENDFKAHKTDTTDRMARMETKIDYIHDHVTGK